MYEVFPGSISQEGNWIDSVRNHDNEYVVDWAILMLFCGVISCHTCDSN